MHESHGIETQHKRCFKFVKSWKCKRIWWLRRYGTLGQRYHGKGGKELAPNFGQRVIDARRKKGIEQRDLARAISERVNIIQRVERGQHPGDSVIKKLERFLNIVLMIERSPDEQRKVGPSSRRAMTLGDYIQDALRKE